MQSKAGSILRLLPVRCLLVLLCLSFAARAHASLNLETATPEQLATLEQQAEHADRREQCFLFTELIQVYAARAAHQFASGENEAGTRTLLQVRAFADRIHSGLARDSKKVRNAEMLLHTASFRLGQFLHGASDEDRPAVQTTLAQLDRVHEEMLAQVFAH